MRRLTLCAAAAMVFASCTARAQNAPVGHWVAEHTSTGGIGSWWDFRADGTLTMTLGAAVTSHYTMNGDTLMMPTGRAGVPPMPVQFKIVADVLTLSSNGNEVKYTRIGPAPSTGSALLGRWRPVAAVTPTTAPSAVAMQRAQANAVYLFTEAGEEILRLPFVSRPGAWDAKTGTFHVKEDPTTYSYSMDGGKLVLTQPPDGKRTDTYLPDPVFP